MEEKIIQTRLKNVCKALGISERKFALSIGRSDGYVNSLSKTKGEGIPSNVLSKISDIYPMVNKDYILAGHGEPLLDETDTLRPPYFVDLKPDDYKELCMAYRQALADAREEITRLREAYFQLMETNNRLMANLASLNAAMIKAGVDIDLRANIEPESNNKS